MKKISLDWDEVLYDLGTITKQFIYENYGVYPKTKNIGFDYYLYEFPKIIYLWNKEEEYSRGNMIDGSTKFISELLEIYNKGEIQIVTNSMIGVVDYKNKLINELFGDIDVIHTKDKYLVTKGTILIDDALHNIEEHISYNKYDKGVIFDLGYSWNQENIEQHSRVTRCNSYDEVITYLKYNK